MKSLIYRAIEKQERALGAPLQWMRGVARTSVSVLVKLALVGPLANHRKCLPKHLWHTARLATTLHEDCGECVQIVVNLAVKDGVEPTLLASVLRGDIQSLPQEVAEVLRFTRAIAAGQDDPELREGLRARFGEQAFVELAVAIATSRLIPTTKRALGYAQSCSLVKVHVGTGSPATDSFAVSGPLYKL